MREGQRQNTHETPQAAEASPVTPETVAVEALNVVEDKVVEWWIDSLLGEDPAGDIQRRFDDIDSTLTQLEAKVSDLQFLVKGLEVNDVARQADRDRSMLLETGLIQCPMFPEMCADFETKALGVAITYFKDSFYTFIGQGTNKPTHFDYRLAAPTAIEAVNSWLVFRGLADKYARAHGLTPHPLNTETKNNLLVFADQLDGKVTSIYKAEGCWEKRATLYKKVNGQRKAVGCTITDWCEDDIAETFVYDVPPRTTGAVCKDKTSLRQLPTDKLLAQYEPEKLHAVAEGWRKLANLPDSTVRNVFVTSALYSGNLGGLSGADNKCQSLAAAAHLAGTYKAWLSDATGSPSSRFSKQGGPFVLAKRNIVVANSWADFASGTHQNPLDSNENGLPAPLGVGNCSAATGGHQFWSDTSPSGDLDFSMTCNNWSTSVDTGPDGPVVGRTDAVDSGWTSWCHGSNMCQGSNPLLCVQQ